MYYTNTTVVLITGINRFQIGILYEKGALQDLSNSVL